jgi:hypothetical protein
MATTRPRSTRSDEEYRKTLENNLNWQIFANISLGAASGLWRYIELGRMISQDELPKILAGTWPKRRTPISGALIRWSIPFMFLAGLGVECLLKAIRILQFRAAGKPLTNRNNRASSALARELKTHDLLALARAAAIPITRDEEVLLERLTDFVEWAGRYPVGVAADRTVNRAGAYYPSDRDAVFALVGRLKEKCNELDPNRELYKRMEKEICGDEPPA